MIIVVAISPVYEGKIPVIPTPNPKIAIERADNLCSLRMRMIYITSNAKNPGISLTD